VEATLKKTNEVMKRKFNEKREDSIDYQKGDLVWIDSCHSNPFPVTKKIGASSYELRIFILYFVYDRSKYLVTGPGLP